MPRLLGLAQVEEVGHGGGAAGDDQVCQREEGAVNDPGDDGVGLGASGELVVAIQDEQAAPPIVAKQPFVHRCLDVAGGMDEEVFRVPSLLRVPVAKPQ